MRIDYRYGAAVGILAAAFATLGPAAAQAGQYPGTLEPACAGACGLEAPAVHITGIASRSIVLSSTVERSSYNYGYGRDIAFTGQRDREVVKSDQCKEDWSGGRWHRACKSCRFGEFKDVKDIKVIRPFKLIKPVKPCKPFTHFGKSHHGNFGHYGHVSLESHDSRLS